MKRRTCLMILILALTVLLPLTHNANAGVDKEIRVVAPWAAKGWEPVRSGYVFSRMNCLERLTAVDDQGKLIGQLAESWQVSGDKLTWTFNLRKGVKFHDGAKLTAKEVAACLNRSKEKKSILSKSPITSIEAKGEHQIIIRTERPFSPLPAYLCHYATVILAPSSFDEKGAAKTVVGTGPYKLVSNQANKVFTFQAFDEYWGNKPFIKKASYHAAPKGEARGNMIRSGQADMAFTLSAMDADRIKKSGAKVVMMIIPRTRLIKLNCNLPMFRDKSVRKALSLGINRAAIAKAILRNPGSAASQLLAPGVGEWHDASIPKLAYDPAEAAALLDKAGWKKGPDGIRVRQGKPFEFEILTYSSRPMLPPVATAIQDQLARLGIKVSIKVGESGNIVDRHKDGTLQAALVARNFGMIPEPIGNLSSDFAQGGKWGALGWESGKLKKDVEEYFATFDPDGKKKLRNSILAVLQDELPVIPVTWYENIVAYSADLKDVSVDPLETEYRIGRVQWAK